MELLVRDPVDIPAPLHGVYLEHVVNLSQLLRRELYVPSGQVFQCTLLIPERGISLK